MRDWMRPREGGQMTAPPLAMHVEPDRTVFTDGAREVFSLQVSPTTLAERHWPNGQPGPLQLERAIDDVEVAIEQKRLSYAERGALLMTDSLRRQLPQLRGATRFGKDDVEILFSRLVAWSSTGLATAETQEFSGESAAALLLLREVMHHLGFNAVETPS
jgi:hypothetical protein